MSRPIFALLCLLVVIHAKSIKADDGWPFNFQGQLTAGTPLLTTLEANLKTDTSFSLNHTSAVQVCIQETYPVPPNTSYWSSCTFYFSFPQGTEGKGTLQLRDSDYNVGFSFVGQAQPETISFHVGSQSDICPDDQIWNGKDCVVPVAIKSGTVTQNFTANVGSVFSFTVPKAPAITGSVSVNGPDSLLFALRREGSPSATAGFHDGSADKGHAHFDYPRPGTYYLVVTSTTDQQNVTFSLKVEDCTHSPAHGSGPKCVTPFNHDNNNEGLVVKADVWTYWVVYASPAKPLRVSVASNDASPRPAIYASQGQLPTIGNVDISGCNTNQCGFANVIERTPTEAETWFVGVVSGTDHATYGIWFEQACAPSCAHAGQCTKEGPNVGLCVCNVPEDTGVGCQISSALSRQYVVLAVIWGSAGVLTILVLIANFFSSGKTTYERVV